METVKKLLETAFRNLQMAGSALHEARLLGINYGDEGVAQGIEGIAWQVREVTGQLSKIKQQQTEAQTTTGVEY